MEISFWKKRWRERRTGWHMDRVYPHLETNWPRLNLEAGSTVLVPLCGKSPDLRWLVERGHRVIGIEISEIAVREFFEETGLSFETRTKGTFQIFDARHIQLWQGDFFELDPEWLPPVDAIYDKAALIALPEQKRRTYAERLLDICNADTIMLLNCFEYDPREMDGPPFTVFEDEIETLLGDRFRLELLHEESIIEQVPKFRRRGLSSYLTEKVYLLEPA